MDDPELPPRPDELFLVTRHGGAGLSRGQTRRASFLAPSQGVRLLTGLGPLAHRQAAVLGAGDDAVLTDLSAARHWSLPLPPWLRDEPQTITVSRPPGGARPLRRDTAGRRILLPDKHITSHRSVRVTTVERTWLDCAALVPLPHLVAMGDHALHHSLVCRGDLETVVSWARRRRGVVNARTALPMLDPRAESPPESIVRVHCVLAGLPRPVCNLDVHHEGLWLARVDLAWPEAMLAVEYDGAVHLTDAQRRRDASRRNALQRAGWLVITLTGDDLRTPTLMCRRISDAITERLPPS